MRRKRAVRRREKRAVRGAPAVGDEWPVQWRLAAGEHANLTRATWALGERVKELNCLYGMTQLAERGGDSLDGILQGVVAILPPSWQYPAVTCARIVFEGKAYKSKGFKLTRWRQSAAIMMYGKPAGEVTVCYTAERPRDFEGPFLREERALLDAVAERVGTIALRMAAERQLQDTNRQLELERRALQETNTALRTVLSRIEEEKREIHKAIHANVEKVLMPILHALALAVPKAQRKYVDLLRDNLEEITSPFVSELSRKYHALTPTEIRICNMIRTGMRTKEIAKTRGVSAATISRHRERIRRKLGIANSPVNLATHLQTRM